MPESGSNKRGPVDRAARLAAELRLNLKKRKDQARARAAAAPTDDTSEEDRRKDGD